MTLLISIIFVLLPAFTCFSQNKYELIKFGDFESWVTRNIKESNIIGGAKKTVYAIGPDRVIDSNTAYTDTQGSPWGSSNVMAVVTGITKTSNSVFPEIREDGTKALKMETLMESCKAIGIININVLISGSIYLGKAMEPIKNAKDPYYKIDMGIPFTKRPSSLKFDYKSIISQDSIITRAKSLNISTYQGRDYANVFVFLQYRWEDEKGNIYAKRVGTARKYFEKNSDGWIDNYEVPIYYGDITSKPYFKSYMGLTSMFCAQNSKGKMVPINEVDWAVENSTPTHIILMFSSGVKGAFEGALGNTLYIDNVCLGYND